MSRMRALWKDTSGQMVVELAVMLPTVIALSILAVNVMWYLEAVALFDRACYDAVIVRASSPAGNEVLSGVENDVAAQLSSALQRSKRVEVVVTSSSYGTSADGRHHFTLAPHLRTYTCKMVYTPWPASFSIAGVSATPPFEVSKTKTLVLDPYRTGVVM